MSEFRAMENEAQSLQLRIFDLDSLIKAIFDSRSRIASIHGWCIPATGKEFEVKDRDAIETGLAGIAGSELISDVRARMLSIPAAVPGSLVGYEFERDEQPLLQADSWDFQDTVPVRESRPPSLRIG